MKKNKVENQGFSGKEFKDEHLFRTFNYVFDQPTIMAIHYLSTKHYFSRLEFVISTGKEAHVFRAMDETGKHKAVKVYKTLTSNFEKMTPYLEGEYRFKKTSQDKREIVNEWVKKEYKNLSLMHRHNVVSPIPFSYKDNVLIMEYIGNEEQSAPRLSDVKPDELNGEEVYSQLVKEFSKMFFNAKLIHADFSPFNVLWWNNQAVIIDVGQAVSVNHPKAKAFLERDITNLVKYAKRLGLEKTVEDVKSDLRQESQKS